MNSWIPIFAVTVLSSIVSCGLSSQSEPVPVPSGQGAYSHYGKAGDLEKKEAAAAELVARLWDWAIVTYFAHADQPTDACIFGDKPHQDPWGNPLKFSVFEGADLDWRFEVRSLGVDGVESDDDLIFRNPAYGVFKRVVGSKQEK